jgi:hypothetical protein
MKKYRKYMEMGSLFSTHKGTNADLWTAFLSNANNNNAADTFDTISVQITHYIGKTWLKSKLKNHVNNITIQLTHQQQITGDTKKSSSCQGNQKH